MSDVKTLKVDSTVKKHKTLAGTLGVIESKILGTIIGKRVVEVKYKDKE